MMKNWEINGTEEIGLVTPTPGFVNVEVYQECVVVRGPFH